MKILNYALTRKFRAGDAVAAVAQPVARAIDQATARFPAGLQTNLVNCGGCKKRHDALNRLTDRPGT